MFGGAGIYRDGLMFALISGGEIYLKADKETEERFRAAGCRPFVYSRDGKSATMSYFSAPEDALDDPTVMRDWAELAFEAALRAPRPKKKQAAAADAEAAAAADAAPSPGSRRARSARGRPDGKRAAARRER